MDLDTLITTVYVLVDDWYKQEVGAAQQKIGRAVQMSDSEILTLGIVGQWRVGVPWQSERGMVRYMDKHGRGWFPQMLAHSGYNYRFRQVWRLFVRLQQKVGALLCSAQDVYEVVDSVPLPLYSLCQGRKAGQRHWLWSASLGYSKAGWFWGYRWLLSVTSHGVITGWVLSDAAVQDRWLLQALLSARHLGYIHLLAPTPTHYIKPKRRPRLPLRPLGPLAAVGAWTERPYLADQAFNSLSWRLHWLHLYHANVLSLPAPNASDGPAWRAFDCGWLARHRQIIETVFAGLSSVFHLKRLNPHSSWGLIARLAAIAAAHNLAIFLNRLLARTDLAYPSLLC